MISKMLYRMKTAQKDLHYPAPVPAYRPAGPAAFTSPASASLAGIVWVCRAGPPALQAVITVPLYPSTSALLIDRRQWKISVWYAVFICPIARAPGWQASAMASRVGAEKHTGPAICTSCMWSLDLITSHQKNTTFIFLLLFHLLHAYSIVN